MAKVQNPFLSIAASGSVGHLSALNRGAAAPVMRYNAQTSKALAPKSTTPASTLQLDHRAKVRAAAAAWQSLDAPTKAKWAIAGVSVHVPQNVVYDPATGNYSTTNKVRCSHGYAAFVREWIVQNVVAPNLPMRPA